MCYYSVSTPFGIDPFSFINASIGISHDAVSIPFIRPFNVGSITRPRPFTFIYISICVCHYTMSIPIIITPITFIHISICVCHYTMSIPIIINPITFINISIWVCPYTVTTRLVINPCTCINVSIIICQFSFSMWHAIFIKVPHIYTNSWVNGPALSGFIIIFANLGSVRFFNRSWCTAALNPSCFPMSHFAR